MKLERSVKQVDEILIVTVNNRMIICPFNKIACGPRCSHWKGLRSFPLAVLCYNTDYEKEQLGLGKKRGGTK